MVEAVLTNRNAPVFTLTSKRLERGKALDEAVAPGFMDGPGVAKTELKAIKCGAQIVVLVPARWLNAGGTSEGSEEAGKNLSARRAA